MEKNVTQGQYVAGEGFLRKLDPRLKLYFLIGYVILVLLSVHPLALGLSSVVLIAAWGMSFCPLLSLLKSARGVLIMLAVSELICWIWLPTATVLITFWKVFLITLMSVIISRTTEPRDILDGLRSGFWIGEGAAMSVAIAFDFLPQLGREMERLKVAAASRGAVYEEGNPLQRVTQMIPLLIPLFRSTLRHAGQVADAMDLRGYHAGEKRTRVEPLEYHKIDRIAAALMVVYAAGVLVIRFLL